MKIRTASSWAMALTMCLMSGFAFAQPGETIQAGDMLHIEVHRAPEISTSIRVDSQGNIRLSYIGAVKVAGMSESQASGAVAQALEKVMRKPKVTVTRSQFKGEAAGAEFETGRTAEMVLEIIPLNNSNAESMYGVLRGMNSSGGNVSFDPATNSLIITDTPPALQNIRSAIRQLDEMQSQLTQVRIEAKIAEVRIGAMKEIGVRWFAQGDNLSGGYIPGPRQTISANQYRGGLSPSANESLGGGGDGGGGDGRQFVDDPITQRFNIPATVAVPGQAFLGYVNSGIDLGIMLDMLVAEDEAEMLANPMTVTVNHQKAHIEMVDKIPFTEFGTEISGASSFSTEFLDAGITLDVTPHVHQDAYGPYVKLELKPEVSFPSGSNNGTPILSIRRSETIANVRNNQTLVVGGIMSESQRDVVTKLPWLGDLPVIGVLFRHKEKEKARTELMIFVTPTIFERPEDITWDRMIDTSEHLRDADIAPLAELTGQGDKE